jgi:hypothetical protein
VIARYLSSIFPLPVSFNLILPFVPTHAHPSHQNSELAGRTAGMQPVVCSSCGLRGHTLPSTLHSSIPSQASAHAPGFTKMGALLGRNLLCWDSAFPSSTCFFVRGLGAPTKVICIRRSRDHWPATTYSEDYYLVGSDAVQFCRYEFLRFSRRLPLRLSSCGMWSRVVL